MMKRIMAIAAAILLALGMTAGVASAAQATGGASGCCRTAT